MARAFAALPPFLRAAGVTRREADVLEALARRLPNADIAARLYISVRTVESHVSSLLAKLHATDRSELAAIAQRMVVGPATSARLPLGLLELTERTPLVGRGDELALLRERWDEAVSGRPRVMLIVGEAGIGKSRLVAETAVAADRDGANVVVGHCDEEPLAPYQPVVEALTALVAATPDAILAGAVRGRASEVVRLLPGLARLVTHVGPEPASVGPEAARHRLFEAVAGLVSVAAQDMPLLLALEDLHWADPPTLQLIRHLVRRVDRARLLVLGTVRGSALAGPLLKLGDDLRREHGAYVMGLDGLAVPAITALIAATPGRIAELGTEDRRRLAQHLHDETRGNPLFVGELLRHLETHGSGPGPVPVRSGLPPTIRDVIMRRLDRLTDVTRRVLAVAAVAGRRFRVDLVAQVTTLSADQTAEALQEAQAEGLVDEASERAGWIEFTHALVRETLERELSAARRMQVHRLIGEILEAEDAAGHTAELAYHFHAAATPADHGRAVAYAVAAADEATKILAHERTAALYGNALEALGLAPSVDAQREFELLLLQAAAYRRAGLHEQARRSAITAVGIARRSRRPTWLADASLAAAEAAPVWGADPELVDVLAEALAGLDGDDLRRRARLLARLAQAEYYSASPTRRRELTEQALQAARSTGDDATLAAVLAARHVALWEPADAQERLSVANEIVAVAERLVDPELALQGHAWRLVDLLELGNVAAADQAISDHARLARDLGQPLHIRDSALWAATRALLDGRFADAERESQRALDLGRAHDSHADMFWWAQRYWLILEQDASPRDIAELLDVFLEMADRYAHVPAWRAKIALLHARRGDHHAAEAVASTLSAERFATLPRDAVWIGGLYYLAEVAAFLRNRAQAAALYEFLLPFADRIVVIDRALVCLGSVSRALGLLAGVVGDYVAAESHLRRSLSVHETMGARPLIARTRVDLAQVLSARDPSTLEIAEQLSLARAMASELGMTRLLAQTSQSAP
jgi:DNA-binding CsgD family transcriptional regulator